MIHAYVIRFDVIENLIFFKKKPGLNKSALPSPNENQHARAIDRRIREARAAASLS